MFKKIFLILLLSFSIAFAIDFKNFLTVYEIENTFYYSTHPAHKVDNILEIISEGFVVENKGKMNIQYMKTIDCDSEIDVQKYNLWKNCQEIQKNVKHVYFYVWDHYRNDMIFSAIKTYLPHGIFLFLLGVSYLTLMTYPTSRKQYPLIIIRGISFLLFLVAYEIYSFKKQVNPVFFSEVFFTPFAYWSYFIFYGIIYLFFDVISFSKKGILKKYFFQNNPDEKIHSRKKRAFIIKLLAYFASIIILIHIFFFVALPAYATFMFIYYTYLDKILGWSLFISIAGAMTQKKVFHYIAGGVFIIIWFSGLIYGFLNFSIEEIGEFSRSAIQTPLILFAGVCYMISIILYIVSRNTESSISS